MFYDRDAPRVRDRCFQHDEEELIWYQLSGIVVSVSLMYNIGRGSRHAP